jgi:hypothetical protein
MLWVYKYVHNSNDRWTSLGVFGVTFIDARSAGLYSDILITMFNRLYQPAKNAINKYSINFDLY